MKAYLAIIACLLYFMSSIEAQTCGLQKRGCYAQVPSLTTELVNSRSSIDWNNYAGFLNGLICQCITAAEAANANYRYIVIRFYGICFGLNSLPTTNRLTSGTGCMEGWPAPAPANVEKCNDDKTEPCTGNETEDYVYELNIGSDGLSPWGAWTACVSPSCNTQVRIRSCSTGSCQGSLTESQQCNAAGCPIDGGFSNWSDWQTCSTLCGGGTQQRTRACSNPTPRNGGFPCDGALTATQTCNTQACTSGPVDGGFSNWSDWQTCSALCGGGTQQRTRTCTNPAPQNEGFPCDGATNMTQTCNTQACSSGPVDGGFSLWSSWKTCTRSCGGGTQEKTRTCSNPTPQNEGFPCDGPTRMTQTCNTQACGPAPIDGGFSNWSVWQPCSRSCGGGSQGRTRTCTNPVPQNGGFECDGLSTVTQSCNTQDCPGPVDGGFSNWSDWKDCTRTCGGGSQERTRSCNDPVPQNGGLPCDGLNTMTRACNTQACATIVDGAFSEWSVWQTCTRSCGGGTQTRTRTCTNPAPQNGGFLCDGLDSMEQTCNTQACLAIINGNWGQWTSYSTCSVTCGEGRQARTRLCDSPAPFNGGLSCPGVPSESRLCGLALCPEHGNWGQWSSYSSCTRTCGEGSQVRTRQCNNPPPSTGGNPCPGSATQSQLCGLALCPEPVDGNWGQWGSYSTCTKTCGEGTQVRTRLCDSPAPDTGGKTCPGSSSQTQLCGLDLCPEPGIANWGQWGPYTICSKSCGEGSQIRSRSCNNPPPLPGGQTCPGTPIESQICGLELCPETVNGNWGQWGTYSTCTKTCGEGTQVRTRLCNNPPPSADGQTCPGLSSQSQLCGLDLCPDHGNWGPWGQYAACTKTCGGGSQIRTRSCDDPVPSPGGNPCQGSATESQVCGTEACPVTPVANWGQWSAYTSCTKTCNEGTQVRTRLCDNPAPAPGGETCPGPATESQVCGLGLCPDHGNWGFWSSYTTCSRTCGGGSQTRNRLCNNPAPSPDGNPCAGTATESQICNSNACPVIVIANWGQWSAYSSCTKTCNEGTQVRTRLCNSPAPAPGGETCPGPATESQVCGLGLCPDHGNWGFWSSYTTCSRTCGGGSQTRTRLCNNPAPSPDGNPCAGSATESQICNSNACPANWGQWSAYSSCTKTCNEGTQVRTRLCNSPAPAPGGETCPGPATESQVCGLGLCPDHGNWGFWSSYTTCSRTCGGGSQTRTRLCNNPAPSPDGNPCAGSATESQICNSNACPVIVIANWGQWSAYTSCTKTCNEGTQVRTRLCNSPAPAPGGETCPGPATESQVCGLGLCPDHGNWGFWSSYTTCSRTCGGGSQTRTRLCNNPAPSPDGNPCVGSGTESQLCNNNACPDHGNWGLWGSYTACTATCGGGFQVRTRLCNNPAPSPGGNSCVGAATQSQLCGSNTCPVTTVANWGQWGSYSICSKSCNEGTQVRTRLCNNPPPQPGGQTCPGLATQSQVCGLDLCPDHGNWGLWGQYSTCSRTCGGGAQTRARLCNNPAPSPGGNPCVGSATESQLCGLGSCPVTPIANWGQWSVYSSCTRSCNGGTQIRTRLCNNPAPAPGGQTCPGLSAESRACGQQACPDHGNWGSWGTFSTCSRTCGGGARTRTRLCNNPAPSVGGNPCFGSATETQFCGFGSCPDHGNWGFWTAYTTCSRTCGGGFQSRTRLCNNPAPSAGGNPCDGASTQTQFCNSNACPASVANWGQWSSYSTCSKTCNEGVQRRTRLCNNPPPVPGGLSCSGASVQSQVCGLQLCPDHGNWGFWSAYTTCSRTCGGGSQTRTRLCNNPAPSADGDPCFGLATQSQVCGLVSCPVTSIANWGQWSSYSTCTRTCNGGTQTRTRLCNNPAPLPGGQTCPGSSTQSQACGIQLCPVNGNWGLWNSYTTCSRTCGGGFQTRTRLCNNPPPSNGGNQCFGLSTQSQQCGFSLCPVHGNWGSWTTFTTCSRTCGGGSQSRTRLCNNPTPSNGGNQCLGSGTQTQLCGFGLCPVIVVANWGQWGAYSTCSRTCGEGSQLRSRSCDNPPPAPGGQTCPGDAVQSQICGLGLCPEHGNWGPWGVFAACSVSCGGGNQFRTRLCNNPAPTQGGNQCPGSSIMSQFCGFTVCPVVVIQNANWGPWGRYTACTKTCGEGTQIRSRACDSPPPPPGGQTCPGSPIQSQVCATQLCLGHGNWGRWGAYSTCSRTCGEGSQTRTRLCNNPAPSPGGNPCFGSGTQTQLCGEGLCPDHGNWGLWGAFSICTRSCGGGSQTRTRLCNNPAPSAGGNPCFGSATNTQICGLTACETPSQTIAQAQQLVESFLIQYYRTTFPGTAIPARYSQAIFSIQQSVAQEVISSDPNVVAKTPQERLADLRLLLDASVKGNSIDFARSIFARTMYSFVTTQLDQGFQLTNMDEAAARFMIQIRGHLGTTAFNTLINILGDITLMFVVDTTGSMREEIIAANAIALQIINEPRQRAVDYILSPYNDPLTGPVTTYTTEQKADFAAAIAKLPSHGGFDCKELAFKGMMDALDAGPKFQSSMYVFTDANAKDNTAETMRNLKAMAQASGVRINFFIEDRVCGTSKYDEYHEVAQFTSGQVLPLLAYQDLQNYTLAVRTSLLTDASIGSGASGSTGTKRRRKRRGTDADVFPITVDDELAGIIIIATMRRQHQGTRVVLKAPNGEIIKLTTITAYSVMYQIESPSIGKYELDFRAVVGDHSYKAQAISKQAVDFSVTFEYRLSDDTEPFPIQHPRKGEMANAIVQLAGVEAIDPATVQISVLDEEGVPLGRYYKVIKNTQEPGYKVSFMPPNYPFKLAAIGKTMKGNHFQRDGYNIYSPSLYILRSLFFGKTTLTCKLGETASASFQVIGTTTRTEFQFYFKAIRGSITPEQIKKKVKSMSFLFVTYQAPTDEKFKGKTDVIQVVAEDTNTNEKTDLAFQILIE